MNGKPLNEKEWLTTKYKEKKKGRFTKRANRAGRKKKTEPSPLLECRTDP